MIKEFAYPEQRMNTAMDINRFDVLYKNISTYLHSARRNILHSIDAAMVTTYWLIGRDIVEEEQKGAKRAGYGTELMKQLSRRLTKEFGSGFRVATLENARKFYTVYGLEKSYALRMESEVPQFNKNLSWTHYRSLMREPRAEVRAFYEIEASNNAWSARELNRQIGSLLFDRLAKSKDKSGLMELVYKGQEITKPEDAIKDPVILEFLELPEAHQLVESKLEEALISNLQSFLLELGKGFAFVARQKRLTLDGEHFYTDLVFYHTILKAFVIIDLKTRQLTHADLGQMQLYVNYFDQEIRAEDDNPTIGLILCTKQNKMMVKYFFGGKNKNIFASKYQFHLPTEYELEEELKREIKKLHVE